jgi:CRP-like cAMP-binding protein
MDYNLILTAQTLVMAPYVRESVPINGMLVVKNIPAKTYLHVTTEQWVLLQQFRQPRTVPAVLGYALEERLCLPLDEFFELILKAVRANILMQPQAMAPEVKSTGWRGTVRAETIARPLLLLFFVGLVMTLGFRPELPKDYLDVLAGLGVLCAALSIGSCIVGCIIRGSSGEVYHPRWEWLAFPPHFRVDKSDAIMLPARAQQAVTMARPAMLATATGLIAWHRPEWNLLPLIGLAAILRPILGGRIASLFRLGRGRHLSDAEHAFIFPPNLRPRARWRLLGRTLSHPDTWVKLVYGIIWTLAVICLAGRLVETPPWTIAFWKTNGVRVAVGAGGSLAILLTGFVAWEIFQFVHSRARHRRQALRLWERRWFGAHKVPLDEKERIQLASNSPLLRTLPLAERHTLVQAMQPVHHRSRHWCPEFSGTPTHAALIVSGTMGLYRELPSGRPTRVQVLSEGDFIGLQDLADPEHPAYRVRTLTPVTLLMIDRATLDQALLQRTSRATLTNLVLKLPFLRRIPLCRNWHPQAVERFAHLSSITDCAPNGVIVTEGDLNHHFFVIFEQDAIVTRNKKRLGVIRAGEFFGEIGLLQNSSAMAGIVARHGTRCLSISRPDFLRFVTHNHLVALELERVSSKRLGRAIFPLGTGNFRAM